ncbi:MAG: Ig-like domain-containing protein [Myxococcota bacterium]|nr:Ig-like domain-containing protein [Myxococcota bacterium]MDW8361107.1 Ig-like domain-containing protein [Myxococcales bacterium]
MAPTSARIKMRRRLAAIVPAWTCAVCRLLLGLGGILGCGPSSERRDAATPDASPDGRPDVDAAAADGPSDEVPPMRVNRCRPDAPALGPYPAPDAHPRLGGPGGPARRFEPHELGTHCAYIDGGEGDVSDHHNLVTMLGGYLVMPWAPEWGGGGISLYDVRDPCAPRRVGYGYSERTRETHAIGFSRLGGLWAVVDGIDTSRFPFRGGVQFWDLSDPTQPTEASHLALPGFAYPDAYARVTLSTFWQVPFVYAGGADNGIYVIDATDPRRPVHVATYVPEPIMRVGQVQVIGNLLIATTAEGPRTLLLDVSDPEAPQPMPGGDFLATDATGRPREAYFSTFADGFIYYALKDAGGGLLVWDVRDPRAPRFAGLRESGGNGGYVFVKEGFAYQGESSFAVVYDVRDPARITEVARYALAGDLDTATPIGNVVVLSVDADAEPDRGTAVVPHQAEPDRSPPRVSWLWPPDGAVGLPSTSRFGVSFNEHVDFETVWEGSVRLWATDRGPDAGRVRGQLSAQEAIVNFTPDCPLEPNTSYTLEIVAGGVADLSGNRMVEGFRATFRTGP